LFFFPELRPRLRRRRRPAFCQCRRRWRNEHGVKVPERRPNAFARTEYVGPRQRPRPLVKLPA
jgi:hypothetical protein